jgi:hypothetical protein
VAAALGFKKAKPDPDRQTERFRSNIAEFKSSGAVFAHTLALLLH